MKLKNVLLTLGLALGAGAAVGAGAAKMASNNVIDASASKGTNSHVVFVAVYNDTLANYPGYTIKVNANGGGCGWDTVVADNLNDTTTYPGYTVFYGSFSESDNTNHYIYDLQFQIYQGDSYREQHAPLYQHGAPASDYENKVYFYADNKQEGQELGGSWASGYTLPNRTVTKLAVEFVAGAAQSPADWNLGSDEVLYGTTYQVPSGVAKDLEHFVGWYTDTACTVAYTATVIHDDMTLYAKYTKLDSYFYWSQKDSGDITHIYLFGDYQPLAWPGFALADYKVSDGGTLQLNKDYGSLYKIPVPSTGSISYILNNNNNIKSSQDGQPVERGKVLFSKYSHTDNGIHWYNANFSNTSYCVAADFLIEFESYRLAVPSSSGIAQYSVCGLKPSDAASLWTKYDNLQTTDATARGFIDNSLVYTYVGKYDGEHTPSNDNQFMSAIMTQVYKIALLDEEFAQTHQVSFVSPIIDIQDNSIVIVSIVAMAAIASAAGFFFVRRKNEQ